MCRSDWQPAWVALACAQALATGAPASASALVCYDDVLEPYFMHTNDGYRGLNADLVGEAARRAGVAVEFREMPFKRIEQELKHAHDGAVGCAFAFSRTAARDAYMLFTDVVLQTSAYVLFVRDGSPIRSLDDLRGKAIGVRRGFRLPDALASGESRGTFHTEEVGDDESNFKKLAAGRVDAVLINEDVGHYMLVQMKLSGIHAVTPPLARLDTYLVFARTPAFSELVPRFDKALADMQQDGTFARLRARYLGDDANAR